MSAPPGGWKASQIHYKYGGMVNVIKTSHGDEIAQVADFENAELMAAAPEMLAALKALRSVAAAFRRWPNQDDPVHAQLPIALDIAEGAIAKAKGTK